MAGAEVAGSWRWIARRSIGADSNTIRAADFGARVASSQPQPVTASWQLRFKPKIYPVVLAGLTTPSAGSAPPCELPWIPVRSRINDSLVFRSPFRPALPSQGLNLLPPTRPGAETKAIRRKLDKMAERSSLDRSLAARQVSWAAGTTALALHLTSWYWHGGVNPDATFRMDRERRGRWQPTEPRPHSAIRF
jgi:hypothetical protein